MVQLQPITLICIPFCGWARRTPSVTIATKMKLQSLLAFTGNTGLLLLATFVSSTRLTAAQIAVLTACCYYSTSSDFGIVTERYHRQ